MRRHASLALVLALVVPTVAAFAQTHRWHNLTPDSLSGVFFTSVALAYDGDTRVLFAGYERGLLKSTDDGEPWQHVLQVRNAHDEVPPGHYLLRVTTDDNRTATLRIVRL